MAARLYAGGPSAEELALIGLTAEDVAGDAIEVEVWPDNLVAVNLFCRMTTQWHSGFNGPTGMIYSELGTVMSYLNIELEPDEKTQLFEDIQVLERSALNTMAERQKSGSK